MTFTYERKANYYETDMMGVVHHSNYLRYFEEARIAFMDSLGIPYKELEENGIMSPVLSVQCEYKRMVQFGETMLIKVSLIEYNGIRMKLNYEIVDKKSGKVTARGITSHCFLSKNGRPVSLKNNMTEYHEKFLECLDKVSDNQ